MHNFTKVYSAVKWHCEVEGFPADKDCVETIAETANVSPDNLPFYLNTLKNLGLISYFPGGTIELTETGLKQEALFA